MPVEAAADPPSRLADRPVISENRQASDRAVVADLRRASARYPHDRRLAALIRGRLDGNARIYTAAPGSEDATKLDLARVAGIGQDSPIALPAGPFPRPPINARVRACG